MMAKTKCWICWGAGALEGSLYTAACQNPMCIYRVRRRCAR